MNISISRKTNFGIFSINVDNLLDEKYQELAVMAKTIVKSDLVFKVFFKSSLIRLKHITKKL